MKVIYNSEPNKIVLLDARKLELVSVGLTAQTVNIQSVQKAVKIRLQNITLHDAKLLLCKDVIDLTPYQSGYPCGKDNKVITQSDYPSGEEYLQVVRWFKSLSDADLTLLETMYSAFYHACILASENLVACEYYLGDFRRHDIDNIKLAISKSSKESLPDDLLV